MESIGLIAEYNPFHLGHAYQLNYMQETFPNALKVVVMSGNIVQRGQFAILDKWHRAEIALSSGADIVIELPLLASLQSADYFAYWSVDILQRLQVNHLIFGTESANIDELMATHQWIQTHQSELDIEVQKLLGEGKSYANATYEAIRRLDVDHFIDLPADAPNQLLGLKYIEANERYAHPMTCHTLVRQQGYNSGSQIRSKFYHSELLEEDVPQATWQALQSSPFTHMEHYFDLIKYQIISKSPQELAKIQSVREGFEQLLKKEIILAETYQEFVQRLTSKRWTNASVQRILMNLLLNIQTDEWQAYQERYQQQAVVRVLAYKEKARPFLSQFRNHEAIHLVSNLTKESYNQYELMIRADQIYQIGRASHQDQNIGRFPINEKNLSIEY